MSRLVRSKAWRRRLRRSAPALRRIGKAIDDAALLAFWQLCDRLSAERAARLGAFTLGMLGPLTSKQDKIETNLEIAFPGMPAAERARVSREIWRNLGAIAGEYPHLGGLGRQAGPTGPGIVTAIPPHLVPNFTGERLTVFATGHLANWEILAVAPRLWGLHLATVYTPIGEGRADRRLRAYRERMGATLLPRDGSARTLLRHLKSGKPIGIVADHRSADGAELPFLGKTKETTLSPARLALKTGADFVAVRVERLGPARFRISAAGPFAPPVDALDDQAKAAAMMTAFNRTLEAWIRERPEEWLCGQRFFPKAVVKALRHAEPAAEPAAREIADAP